MTFLTQSDRASSQMDPLLVKAESIITYLRKGKKCGVAAVRGVRNMWEKQPCRHRGQCRRRERSCSRAQSRNSLAACGQEHGESGLLCPAAHGGAQWSRDPPAASGGICIEAGGCNLKLQVVKRALEMSCFRH